MKIEQKRLGIMVISLLLVLLFSSSVLAWGLLPARQLAPFTQSEQQLKISVKNTDYSDGYFVVEFAGDLSSYATYKGGTIYVGADQSSYDIPFTLTLPQELEPGKRTLKVILKEVASKENTATVNSLLTLVGEVIVNAPQQGNFVTSQVFIDQVSESLDVPFTITLLNKGDDAVVVYADVIIKGPTNLDIASWSTDKIILDYLGNGKIETYWSGEKQSGLYNAQITLHHGDKVQILRKEFVVGNKEVISESISSSNFDLGEIVPLSISALNKWNDDMAAVYAEIFVLSKEGQLIQKFKSLNEDILANSKVDLNAYWDTKNLLVGYYDLNVVINYPGGQTQKQYPVSISLDKLQVDNTLTGQVIEDTSNSGNGSLMIILLIVLIVSNVIIILYFKRMKKGGKKKEET